MTTPSPFVEFGQRYAPDPVLFVREVLGVPPDQWQVEVLEAYGRGERRMAVRSGHGVGKSTVASWLMLHHLLCRYPQKTVVTAPTSSQLFDALFAELKSQAGRLPKMLQSLLDVKSDRIELKARPSESFITARTSRPEQPEALAGVHSDNVLLVADEASGVPEQVFEAAAGSMSGHSATTLLLGNPVRVSGYFYDVFHKLSGSWWTRRVSCYASPRVSRDYIEEMKARYGEDSNAFRIRVLGEFPRSDDNTIIPLELVEAAIYRDVAITQSVKTVWGLDVARFGDDRSALAKRKGNYLAPVVCWSKTDLMQTSGRVKAEWDSVSLDDRPIEILVDSIGLGAGVCDRLRELGLPARGVNVSESPAMGDTYGNLRAELWFKCKAWLEKRDCKLPKDEQLQAELVTPRYTFRSNGKIQVESKDEMKKRGLRSPDLADAVMLTFASEAGVALHGTSYSSDWQKPIKRNLAIV